MKIEERDIESAVKLSLFNKEEIGFESLKDDVKNILKYVEDISSIDSKDEFVKNQITNVFREDEVTVEKGVFREAMLKLAPSVYKNWISVTSIWK